MYNNPTRASLKILLWIPLCFVFIIASSSTLAYDTAQLGFNEILYNRHPTFNPDHYYTDFINGMDSSFRTDNGIYKLNLDTLVETPIITAIQMPVATNNGIFGRFSLRWDAQKIVFDFKESIDKGFRIWEVNIDGSGLRQITFPPANEAALIARYDKSSLGAESPTYNNHTDDMHPCYLPDGGFMFTSTRGQTEIFCNPTGQFSVTLLHRVDNDGSNLTQLSHNGVSEFQPVLLSTGQVAYSRFEYVDKASLAVKGIWAVNPDGSKSVELFGNTIVQPAAIVQPREFPNNPMKFAYLGTPHYPQGPVGSVLTFDLSKDIREGDSDISVAGGKYNIDYFTPNTKMFSYGNYESGWFFNNGSNYFESEDGIGGKLYSDPYPVNDNQMLVSCKFNNVDHWTTPSGYDLYLVNDQGVHELILNKASTSCFIPTPIIVKPKPHALHDPVDPVAAANDEATVIVHDIYQGMNGVPRGSIKWIRINEQVPRPWGSNRIIPGFEHMPASVNREAHLYVKLQYGIVPVEADGSAYFKVPAHRNIFLQALDENYLEVQRERTLVNYMPGEVRSCTGCHERPGEAPKSYNVGTLIALTRPPSTPQPQPGETTGKRPLYYATDVQPVWDNNCISCHGNTSPAAGISLTSNLTQIYNASYDNLINHHISTFFNGSKTLLGLYITEDFPISVFGWSDFPDVKFVEPYSLGSHSSRLYEMLRDGHQGVNLTEAEMVKVTTWLDANIQYYGTYYGRRDIADQSHPNFRPVQTVEQVLAPEPDAWINWADR